MPEVVRILRLATGGDGVGRLADGRTVFVPRTAPDDLIEITGLREHRRFARAAMGRLLESSPSRSEPRCPHYIKDECGGCQLQHLEFAAQRDARRGFVGDALRRIAKREVADPDIVPAPQAYEYRTKLTLAVSADGRRIGLHPFDRPTHVFQLERCHIARPELMALWQAARGLRPLFPNQLTQVVLRLDRRGGTHLVFRVAGGEVWSGAERLHAELVRREQATTIWWQPEGGAPRAMAGAVEAFPVTAFEQIYPEMGDRIRAFAITALGDVSHRHLWDLYAGIGETTERLVAAGASVESVEADRQAVAAAESTGVKARRHLGKVEDVVSELRRPAMVITNPPRTGMHERVTAALDRIGPSRIVYISCDPATLARDLVRLPTYRLVQTRAFDLFPQTAHVETVVTLERV